MLVRPGADAEPSVIGEIDQPARSFARWYRAAWEDRFVADERQHLRRARDVHRAPAVARLESADHFGELHEPDTFEQTLERQIFAERHQMHFVVDAADRSLGGDDVRRIIGKQRW